MNTFFYSLLNMSISGSITIIGVFLLRFICRKLPKRWTIYLWCMAAFRLLCPISFVTDVSVFQYTTIVNGQMQHLPNSTKAIAADLIGNNTGSMVKPAHDFMKLILDNFHIIWVTIVIVLLIQALYRYMKLSFLLRARIQIKDHIYIHDQIRNAFVFGFFSPKIYLPSDLEEVKQQTIILHEQAHIDRKDYIWKPIIYLMVCVYWFNPLVWLAFYYITMDMEMACDEQATKTLSGKEKVEYSEVLLSMAYKNYDYIPSMAFGKLGTSQRIKHLLNFRKQSTWFIVLIVFIIGISAIALLSNPDVQSVMLSEDKDHMETLYESRTSYVGDATKVRNIIDKVPLPDGLQIENIQLQSSEMPYGVTIQYTGTPTNRQEMNSTFIRDAALIMALVGNLESVEFYQEASFSQTYTLTDMQGFYPMSYANVWDSYRLFEELYQMDMMNEELFNKVSEFPIDLSMNQLESKGVYVMIESGIRNAEVEQKFYQDAKDGLDAEMTMVTYTKENEPILTIVRHDKRGYRYILDRTRDTFGNQSYQSYILPYMVAIPTENGNDIYLTAEADLNAERIQRAQETGEYVNYLYVYHQAK